MGGICALVSLTEEKEGGEGLYLLRFCVVVPYLPWRFGRALYSYDRCHADLSKNGKLFISIRVTRP